MQINEEQVRAIKDLIIIAGVSEDVSISIQALNNRYIQENPVGPHNSESVAKWIDDRMDQCRKTLVPLFWNKDN